MKRSLLATSIIVIMLLLAEGLLASCNNKPIDESRLPDFEAEQAEQSSDTGQVEDRAGNANKPAGNAGNAAGSTSVRTTDNTIDENTSNTDNNESAVKDQSKCAVSEDEAKSIALSRVPGASKADIYGFNKEFDDGHWIYEGEIVYNGVEYEFEMDACTGNILKWELDD